MNTLQQRHSIKTNELKFTNGLFEPLAIAACASQTPSRPSHRTILIYKPCNPFKTVRKGSPTDVRAPTPNDNENRASNDRVRPRPILFLLCSPKVVYTPSSLGTTEIGDVILVHPDLGDWVFEASGVGEMPGVMQEHRAVATVGTTTSTMFPFR